MLLDAVLFGHLLHDIDSTKGQATSKEDIHHTVFSDWRNERLHAWLARIEIDGLKGWDGCLSFQIL